MPQRPPPLPPPPPVDSLLEVDLLFADRYQLEEEIGTSGATSVWSAYDTFLAREVLVERRPTVPEATQLQPLERGASGVLAPTDAGTAGDTDFTVVERLHGETLARRMEREGSLPTRECARLLTEIAQALGALHDRGTTHGAIDARSIFFERPTSADEPARVLLLATGVAPILEAGGALFPAAGAGVRSPEQILAADASRTRRDDATQPAIGPASDAFALAATLYLALTGRSPFVGRTAADTQQRILSASYDSASTLRRGLTPSVDAFFRRAFSVDPERRFGSVHELGSVFRMLVDDETHVGPIPGPASVPPRSRVTPALRFAALAAVLAAGAIAALVMLLDASEDANAAEPPPVNAAAALDTPR